MNGGVKIPVTPFVSLTSNLESIYVRENITTTHRVVGFIKDTKLTIKHRSRSFEALWRTFSQWFHLFF